ncbi:M56 family metallopeptidase [Pseudoalteromonas sp. T1lg23B]|uniref:M56 family metallopeptidase n=1 Tax=Pseudoalteromonas sp. T1lg23B TaxID=2077097 RepID=UPI001319F1E5|nr:TonB family protein [Pseudoalteromonas sp. T1lg23B]
MLTSLFDWVLNINNQLIISSMVLALMALQRYTTPWLGSRLIYALWWVLPLGLVAIALPSELKPITSEAISYFRVTAQPYYFVPQWQFSIAGIYWGIVITLLLWVIYQHHQFVNALNIKASPQHIVKQPVYTSAQIATPMVVGLWHPKIVFPHDYAQQFDPDTLPLLIEHELTHIRRADNLANLALLLLCISCWFNPVLWLGYHNFRKTQELACDETVLQQKTTHQQLMYAKALLRCAENSRTGALVYAYYGDKQTMVQRLKQLQNITTPSMAVKALALVIACSSLSAMALAKSTDPAVHNKGSEVRPIMRIEPAYPSEAANAGQTGYVTLQFTIDGRGHTNNIEVIDAQPQGVFEQSAINALRQWQYTPASNTSELYTVQLDYAMNEDATAYKQKVKHERIKVAH